jgi:hypothetical protein
VALDGLGVRAQRNPVQLHEASREHRNERVQAAKRVRGAWAKAAADAPAAGRPR